MGHSKFFLTFVFFFLNLRFECFPCSLLSFGKFLELLIYSPSLSTLKPTICKHTTSLPQPLQDSSRPTVPSSTAAAAANDNNLPTSRLNIVRHFAMQERTVMFSLAPVDYVFEIRVPRLQIQRSVRLGPADAGEAGVPHGKIRVYSSMESIRNRQGARLGKAGATTAEDADSEKKLLRREIKRWWEGVAGHIDKLVRF